MARTGLSSPTALGVVGAGFLLAGAALLLARRRR
ncbi:LPXTG cell wall anchor domain-containing protein [Streptomyces sp. AK04-3B]